MSSAAIRSATFGRPELSRLMVTVAVLEQPRRRLAGRDRLQQRIGALRGGAPGPRRSPTGAARAQSAGCSSKRRLGLGDGRGCPAGWPPTRACRSAPSVARARPPIVARFALRVDRPSGPPCACIRGCSARSRRSITFFRSGLHVAELEVADDVDAQRDRRSARVEPSSWPASRAARRACRSSSAAPRSWSSCWIAFKSSSRSAGGRLRRCPPARPAPASTRVRRSGRCGGRTGAAFAVARRCCLRCAEQKRRRFRGVHAGRDVGDVAAVALGQSRASRAAARPRRSSTGPAAPSGRRGSSACRPAASTGGAPASGRMLASGGMCAQHLGGGAADERVGVARAGSRPARTAAARARAARRAAFRLWTRSSRSGSPAQASSVASSSAPRRCEHPEAVDPLARPALRAS